MSTSSTLTPDLAAGLYRSIEDRNARVFLDFLIDHPDEQFNSEHLQRELSFSEHRQVALAAYSIGELAESLGLARPWTEGQKGYIMSASVAGMLARARQDGTV